MGKVIGFLEFGCELLKKIDLVECIKNNKEFVFN